MLKISRAVAAALFSFAWALLGCAAAFAQAPFALHDGDRIVCYGDSITAQQLYSNDAEAFVLTRFPKLSLSWWNAGWGGDTVRGGGGGSIDVRLKRDLLPYQPTCFTVMLAMNDGGYRPFDQATFEAYQAGYEHIIDVVKQANPGVRATLIVPSPYDDITRQPAFPGGYNGVLLRYGDAVKQLAQANGFNVADFNAPMTAMLARAKAQDPGLASKILPDRVHPSSGGHLVMAEALLKSWNFPAVVSAVAIDAAGGKATQTANAVVTNLKVGPQAEWDELEGALPLPINTAEPLTALVLASSDFVASMDQETLQVTGLTASKYTLSVDGQSVGAFSREDLAAGVNLATLATPMNAQAQHVMELTNRHVGLHFARFHNVLAPLENDSFPEVKQALPPLVKAMDDEDAAIVAQQRAAAQPVSHHFALAPAQ